jgi:Secretion system C-terminal sorting domain
MKKKHFFTSLFLFAFFSFLNKNLTAQCNCNQQDPYGYCNYPGQTTGQIGSSCSLQPVTFAGSTSVANCGVASCSVSSLYQDYNIYFPYSNTVTGIYYRVVGGVVSRETIYRGNFNPPLVTENCTTERPFGSVNYINSVALRINWTTSSPSNCILIWGYTGLGNYPTMLSYFGALSVSVTSATSAPAAPNNISISSPVTYGTCGWKVASSFVSNAASYTWFYAGSGTYPDIVGPTIGENQTAFLGVRANNACGVSSIYTKYVAIPNNPSCGYARNPGLPQGTEVDVTPPTNETEKFIISPNPASNLITVIGITSETVAVNVLSADGKTMRHVTVNGQNRIHIDVANLAKGLYVIVLRQKDGTSVNKKVMLQ